MPPNLIKLERGKPYPLQTIKPDGAAANFLTDAGNILLVSLAPISADDEWVFRNGNVKAGLLSGRGAILLLFQFLDKHGRSVFTFDCPFNATLIPRWRLNLPNMDTPQSRLLFELHAVDGDGILRALRALTLPLSVSTRFLSAVQDQFETQFYVNQNAYRIQLNFWNRHEPAALAETTTMELCGS